MLATGCQPVEVNLSAYAAAKRYGIEIGGITIAGVPIATDDRSKTMIMGARIKADADPEYEVRWLTESGFVVLSAVQIVGISNAILAHVDFCFAAEANVIDQVNAGTITTTSQIDSFGRPSNLIQQIA